MGLQFVKPLSPVRARLKAIVKHILISFFRYATEKLRLFVYVSNPRGKNFATSQPLFLCFMRLLFLLIGVYQTITVFDWRSFILVDKKAESYYQGLLIEH